MKWFYNSKQWKYAREQALHRDHFTCSYCGARATEVHHLEELNETNVHDVTISLNLDNLQSLCHDCHSMITMQEHGIKGIDCEMNYYFDEEGNLQRLSPPVEQKNFCPE